MTDPGGCYEDARYPPAAIAWRELFCALLCGESRFT